MPRIPTVCREKVLDQIVVDVRHGLPFSTACLKNKVKVVTFNKWRESSKIADDKYERGEELTKGEQLLIGFEQRLQAAKANFEADLVMGIYSFVDRDWRAGLELLKRRFRHNWGDPSAQTTVSVNQSQSQAQASITNTKESIQEALTNNPAFVEFQRQRLLTVDAKSIEQGST